MKRQDCWFDDKWSWLLRPRSSVQFMDPSQMFTVNYGLLICSVSTFGNKSINVGDKLDLFTMDFYMPISFDASLFLILA